MSSFTATDLWNTGLYNDIYTDITRSLRDVNEMNSCKASHFVCAFARMIQELLEGYGQKFGMDVMPFGTNLQSYFQYPIVSNSEMVDEKTCGGLWREEVKWYSAPYQNVGKSIVNRVLRKFRVIDVRDIQVRLY
jgi:hypothetical protein